MPYTPPVAISFEYLLERLSSRPFLLDVRYPSFFRRGNIPGSINIPQNRVWDAFFRLDPVEFEHVFLLPKPLEDNEVIVYCQYGLKARKICDLLAVHGGYQQVKLYQGGWQEWTTRLGIQTVRRLRDVQLDLNAI